MAVTELYFLAEGSEPEREVTREEFMAAERQCGLIPWKPGEVATAGFTGQDNSGRSVRGRVEFGFGPANTGADG